MNQKEALYNYLVSCISDKRRDKIERYSQLRTRWITLALEDIYQSHNASAVLRSAECFGVQDIHVIENRNTYTVSSEVAMGSSKWVDLIRYREKNADNTIACIHALKAKGYRIVATTPHKNDCLIDQLDVEKGPLALFFGTEIDGITDAVINEADEFVKIPMYGFTESFNISVSAAICLYTLTEKLRRSSVAWQISEEERLDLRLAWVRNSLQRPDLLEAEFLKQQQA